MSRGGGRGGFGSRGRGRGGFSGASNLPPMGLSFSDLQNLSREPTALYPPIDVLPVLSAMTPTDQEDVQHQIQFENQMRTSPYYIVETKKSTDLPRYSDKYRITANAHPTLKREDLNPDFFPPEIFETYFNPKKKRKVEIAEKKKVKRVKANFDELEREEQEGSEDKEDEEEKPKDGEEEEPDYDEDEDEDDNDYVEEYFDNGEGDDEDYLGGPRGGDDGGGDTYD